MALVESSAAIGSLARHVVDRIGPRVNQPIAERWLDEGRFGYLNDSEVAWLLARALRTAIAAPESDGAGGYALRIWPWSEAPDELRALSGWGGDETWVVLLPDAELPSFVEQMLDTLGSKEMHEHNGRLVFIGANS